MMDESGGSVIFSEAVAIHESLDKSIYELETLCGLDSNVSSGPPDFDSVMILGRRLAPVTLPPLFSRFNTEVGPLETLPARFRVPFPTMEEFKFSILNHRHENEVRAPAKQEPPQPTPKPFPSQTDEYEDDF